MIDKFLWDTIMPLIMAIVIFMYVGSIVFLVSWLKDQWREKTDEVIYEVTYGEFIGLCILFIIAPLSVFVILFSRMVEKVIEFFSKGYLFKVKL
jgi:hypothetical protein